MPPHVLFQARSASLSASFRIPGRGPAIGGNSFGYSYLWVIEPFILCLKGLSTLWSYVYGLQDTGMQINSLTTNHKLVWEGAPSFSSLKVLSPGLGPSRYFGLIARRTVVLDGLSTSHLWGLSRPLSIVRILRVGCPVRGTVTRINNPP